MTAIDPWGEKIMGFDHNTLADEMSIFEHVSGKNGDIHSTYGDKYCAANYQNVNEEIIYIREPTGGFKKVRQSKNLLNDFKDSIVLERVRK